MKAYIYYYKDSTTTVYGQGEQTWPSTPPYFTWIRVRPYSTKDTAYEYTVHYDSIIEESGPLYDKWEYTPTTEMGANYYKVLADFADLDGGGSIHLNSASEGIKLRIRANFGNFTNIVVKEASLFIKVPYVYGMHNDEDGNYVGKCYGGTKTFQGYYGVDCSGLATLAYDYAYYEKIIFRSG